MNISSDRKRTLSAHAPMIRAGVIAANFSWKAKTSNVGMVGAKAGLMSCMPMPFNPARDRFPIIPSIAGSKCQAVAPQRPDEAYYGKNDEALSDCGYEVFLAH